MPDEYQAVDPSTTQAEEMQPEQLTPAWAWRVVKKQLLAMDQVVEMEGVAPPGDLERKIQEFIDQNPSMQ